MAQNKFSFHIIISGFLLLIMACVTTTVIPTQQPQQPVSTSNPSVFATTVAGKVAAFMTQTVEARPSPTATLLPPTETPSPTTTPSPTITPSPTKPTERTTLSEMEDNSTQFFDYQAGLKLTVPEGWLTVRLSEQEYLDAWLLAVKDLVLQHELESINDLDPDIFRLHALNTQDEYVYEGQGSSIAVLFIDGDTQELKLIAEAELQLKDFENYELITSEYPERADDLELFTLEEQWQVTSSTDKQVTLYHKRAAFKVSAGTVYIDLYVPSEIKDEVLPEFDTMIEQLSVFTP